MSVSLKDSALIMMTRLPRPGRVKTRLAATVGDETAAEFYRLCAEGLFRESQRLPQVVRRYIFYADAEDAARVRAWAGDGFRYEAQPAGNLGRRLASAFYTVFEQGARRAVVVGTDVPDLSAGVIERALALLERYPLVIGPDHGGGYYLLGMRMLYDDLFLRDLSWGTNEVFSQTLRIMRELELVPAFLPVLIDVDTAGDLRRWVEGKASVAIRGNASAASRESAERDALLRCGRRALQELGRRC